MSGRKTVLVVDDDPGTRYVLTSGLSGVLDLFDVVSAADGGEAVDVLEDRPVDVLVTDLAMPVMDGFELIAYVTQEHPKLPVVVLSSLAPATIEAGLEAFGRLRVLRKPAAYQEVAQVVLEELERVAAGRVEGIPLSAVLQLLESERRSCTVVVTSGQRRGRLQFESGRLLNALSDGSEGEGEAAARDILGWSDTALAFEELPDHPRERITVPMQRLLIDVAEDLDRRARPADAFEVAVARLAERVRAAEAALAAVAIELEALRAARGAPTDTHR